MAWQLPISTNTTVSLGTTDNVYVAEGVTIGAGTGITGNGTAHKVEIHGSVLGTTDGVALLPSFSGTVTNSIYIGEEGHVIAFTGAAIGLYGGGAKLENDGEIRGAHWGVYLGIDGNATPSTIVNDGTIKSDQYGIHVGFGGTDAVVKVTNTGTITGTTASFGHGSTNLADETITNKGKMIGDIGLDGGDDKYDGRSGSVKGLVSGGDGADTIYGGNETNSFSGGAGVDILMGGRGADQLRGGTQADTFIFAKITDSTFASSGRDTILDFRPTQSDTIDLHLIDASTKSGGNQSFDFIGSQSFHHDAGELRFQKTSGDTFIYGDVNGDAKADFAIKLEGLINLTDGDFTL